MRIIGDTNIPFLSYRRIAIALSTLTIVAGLSYEFLGHGLNLGIDFVGGTQVNVKFKEQPDLVELRSAIEQLGVGTPLIQRFDEPEKHEVLIRVENPGGAEGDFTSPILDLLHRDFNADIGDRFDLNTRGSLELLDLLVKADPDGVGGDAEGRSAHYEPMAEAVLKYRKDNGIFKPERTLSSAPTTSVPRLARTCSARPSWPSSSRSSACWSTSGSAFSCRTVWARWWPSSTTC